MTVVHGLSLLAFDAGTSSTQRPWLAAFLACRPTTVGHRARKRDRMTWSFREQRGRRGGQKSWPKFVRLRFDKREQFAQRAVPIGSASGRRGGAAVRGSRREVLVKRLRQRPIRWRRNELDHVQPPRLLPQSGPGKPAHVSVAMAWLSFMMPRATGWSGKPGRIARPVLAPQRRPYAALSFPAHHPAVYWT